MKPRIRVKAICVPFVASSPNGTATTVSLTPGAPAVVANNSVSAVSLHAGTAATPVNLAGKQSLAADPFFPNMPEFLLRDGCNVSPFMRAS